MSLSSIPAPSLDAAPTSFLRVAPLVGSAFITMYSHDQWKFLKVFLHDKVDRAKSNAILPTWFDAFFRSGIKVVIGLNTFTSVSALGNLLRDPGSGGLPLDTPARQWYWLGFGLTMAHYLFVPFVMYPVRDMVESKSENSTDDLRKWLKVHVVRTLVVDVPALLSFITGSLFLVH